MKILTLAPHPFFQDRGTPIAVRLLVTGLAGAGHTVDLLTFHEGKDVPLNGARLHRIPAVPGTKNIGLGFSLKKVVCDVALLFRCIALYRRNRYQLLHAVEESVFIAVFMQRIFGVPYVYDMDSSMPIQLMDKYPWLRRFRAFLAGCESLAIRRSAGVVAVCRSLEEEALRHHPTGMVTRLEDVSLLDENEDEAVEALKVPRPFALYVGNLEGYQGIDLLLEGMVRFVETGLAGNLCIVGGSDPDIEKYRQRCEALGLSDRVQLVGPRPLRMLGGLLTQADILLSPRTQGNNTPMKIYSYLDAGKPILATRLPTHTQVLDDNVSCLVEPEPAAMGEGLSRLFGDPAAAAALGSRARQLAQREFTKEVFNRKLIDFYQRLEDLVTNSDSSTGERPAQVPSDPGTSRSTEKR